MNRTQAQYLEKAKRSLLVARQNKESGFPEFALSRAYYTIFYVASAFLEGDGLSFGKHSAVIGAFGKNFAKTGRVPKQFHRYLITAEKARKDADYGVELEITSENAQETIVQAQEMLDFAEANL
ncbi:MAG: HEPN domain-containing protein [Limnothrix sp. RL_2_0]|nr:HEPN domain-containing protein [Limnothrix sp. RL_2_0]